MCKHNSKYGTHLHKRFVNEEPEEISLLNNTSKINIMQEIPYVMRSGGDVKQSFSLASCQLTGENLQWLLQRDKTLLLPMRTEMAHSTEIYSQTVEMPSMRVEK
ncbi:hypothetical protein chiPu_0009588 [Chiloscyllium punctatum]|uniref:Uncharacterized protein n=1 Tax=Chiloscyllium punctatum TaxID=137246 RepID=A0A401SL74_CHIPU|nr:hypothetical protein [Chiloscyllium punctatum]